MMNKLKSIINMLLAASVVPASAMAQTSETDTVANPVNVAFRTVDAQDILGGVAHVNTPEVQEYGYSTYSLSNLGSFLSGYNGASLRGNSGWLLVVDGVPREASNVNPSEIEQITVLKGPEASILYGSKGSNGAILITTKRGNKEGLEVSARANTSFSVAKSYPEYLGAAEYMDTYNKVREAEGTSQLYSDEQIYYTSTGENPYRYPDLNFYSSDYIKSWYNYTDADIELNGGGERAHFYSNIGYYTQGDNLNFGEAKDDRSSKLNIRGNVDVKITKNLTAFINANTTFYDSKGSNGSFWSAASTMRPNYPENANVLIPISMIDPSNDDALALISNSNNIIDGQYFLGGTQTTKTNAIADIYAAGHSKYTSRQFAFDAGVKADLKSLIDGLYFKTDFSVDYRTSYNSSFNNTYATYQPTWGNMNGEDVITSLVKMNEDKKSGVQNLSGSNSNRIINANAMLGYKKSFGLHNIDAMFLANAYQATVSEQYHRDGTANLALLLDYNLGHKYYANASFAIPHTSKLAEDNRNGFSASGTLGWNIKNEEFLKDNSLISTLSLYASLSKIDDAESIDDWYMYEGTWTTSYGYGWADGNSSQFTYCASGSNYSLDFIQRKTISATLKAGFLQDMVTLEGTYFQDKWEGYITKLSTHYPSYLTPGYPSASFVPYENYNNDKRYGFEFGATFKKQFGDWFASAGVYGTWYDTEATRRDETYDYDYQYREGKALDGIWGYQCLGIFQSQDEIDNNYQYNADGEAILVTQNLGETVKPGDLRYVDQNGDGVIDSKDQVYLGKGGWYGAPFTMGVNINVKYKNFTLTAVGTGYFGSYGVKNGSYYWMSGSDAKYSAIARDCWTAETAETATYPRLTTGSGVNNYCTSDFWMYKTNRFNIDRVQLTYDFPQTMFKGNVIKALSVYLTGYNLATISKERETIELNVGSAPQTRQFLLGAKITF